MICDDLNEFTIQLAPYIVKKIPELDQLEKAIETVGKSWSGSWLGYHSRVYYADFELPPANAMFSIEWGLNGTFQGSIGDWRVYEYDSVIKYIFECAGDPDLTNVKIESNEALEKFERIQSEILSTVYAYGVNESDRFFNELISNIEKEKVFSGREFAKNFIPGGKYASRDVAAIERGPMVPPHIALMGDSISLKNPYLACKNLKENVEKLIRHLRIVERKMARIDRVGTNVFIGHGRSTCWRELKDFISDRLNLPWDEFNRVPVAGLTNVTRLAQMLDQACIAFLILTAEDEQADGSHNARMNVIHEVGLFQGRLGFERAIVLLEEGCSEYSNIQGLGQIRFPAGNISAIFEDIRRVLEREGLVN